MPESKILFVVEGLNDEPQFIRRLFQVFFPFKQYKTCSYRTSIHTLAKHLEEDYPDFENEEMDIQLFLKQYETDENQRKLLGQHYTDIFLIFDFEPQERYPHFDTVCRMLSYFNDSTSRGKLFINYPMMQSYKHFDFLPNPNFKDLMVSSDNYKQYKKTVAEVSKYTDLAKYDYLLFMSLATHHLRKANYILSKNYSTPTLCEYLSWDLSQIFVQQLNYRSNSNQVYVLNTSIFILCDYQPESVFRQLADRRGQFMI